MVSCDVDSLWSWLIPLCSLMLPIHIMWAFAAAVWCCRHCTRANCRLKTRGRTTRGCWKQCVVEPGNFSVISWFQTMSWNWKRAANGLRYTCVLACSTSGEPRKSEPRDVINVSLTVTVSSLLLLYREKVTNTQKSFRLWCNCETE